MAAILLFAISPAQANYYTGYTDWAALSPASKNAFVSGVIDYLIQFLTADEPLRAALSRGTSECLIDQHITNRDIAEEVERLYGDYVDLRKVSPAMITYLSIIRRCGDKISKAMAISGLPSLSFQTILHNLSKPP